MASRLRAVSRIPPVNYESIKILIKEQNWISGKRNQLFCLVYGDMRRVTIIYEGDTKVGSSSEWRFLSLR